jgi:hypothetical protein
MSTDEPRHPAGFGSFRDRSSPAAVAVFTFGCAGRGGSGVARKLSEVAKKNEPFPPDGFAMLGRVA